MRKILIIRFSSLGDIAQALAAAQALKIKFPQAEVHWVTRSDMAPLLEAVTCVDRVWAFQRRGGLKGLRQMARALRNQRFDLVYDAHSNLRSHILCFLLLNHGVKFVRRSKERLKRFLLFQLRKNYFQKPYRGAMSYLAPLKDYVSVSSAPLIRLKPYTGTRTEVDEARERICLAPSAAWELKKWPTEYWKKIIFFLEEQRFALLGGPEDKFLEEIKNSDPERVQNWAGRLSWADTAYVIQRTPLLISGDTGALHLGDALGTRTIAILGPTAFGHPSRRNSLVVEKELSCRPCTKDGRGKCSNAQFKKCLVDISPEEVVEAAANLLQSQPPEARP